MKLLTSRMGRNISPDDKGTFKYELHVMTHWRLVFNITIKYKRNIDAQVMKWKIDYTTVTPTTNNHDLIGCLYPKIGSLATVATEILLYNYVVDKCLMNFLGGCV